MNGYPVMLRPQGGSRIIGFGTTGIVCQSSRHPEQVIKGPLRHNLQGCSAEVTETTLHNEEHSISCFEREKLIYSILPKDPAILDCLAITEDGIHFPFLRLGNLREYLELHHQTIPSQIRQQWIIAAASAISILHRYGVIHSDISARNFLVADDLSIKLCDFSGSAIEEQGSLVQEEDRYRMAPDSPRSTMTDIFAFGCLIFEITTGHRPYEEIDDENYQEIESRYADGQYPCIDGLPYQEVMYKCWTCRYKNLDQLRYDLQKENDNMTRL
ncbi:uncharacterized protein N7500_009159 [Penicillium coprophilum]|uniref:uncharacterized protein n=1 Tax=Penicillium coprophilum TaxID=36646 RepID=UPI002386486F|nr:uncharacterized protein N7500_009159 [Penicillium coprophilum]KAJ5153720.1 hypothetical protein N7500_009159 [Penicillium coprophilum]